MHTDKDVDKAIKSARNMLIAVLILVGMWLYSLATGPPYEVKLNIPENSVTGVWMQSTINRHSTEMTKLPDGVKCVRLDNKIYGETKQLYFLSCDGRKGYVRTYQVILP